MSSDDVPPPPQHKPSSSSFADVFKTLAAGRPKSHSPVSHVGTPTADGPPLEMDGRRGSRVTFGFESLHRGGLGPTSPDAQVPPNYDILIQGLGQENSLTSVVEVADTAARHLYGFSADQAVALWTSGARLLDHSESPEARKAASGLLEAVCNRQDLSLAARRSLFQAMSKSPHPDCIQPRVNALVALTDHGRKLDFTEDPILPVIVSWIVPLYDWIAAIRSKLKRGRGPPPNGVNLDDSILGSMFQLIVDIVTLQRHPPKPEDTQLLLEQVVAVCRKTSVAADIKHSLAVFDAVITTLDIPDASFDSLLEVLCSIHASVKSLAGPTARAVRNLARSPKQLAMVNSLHTFLLEAYEREDRNLNVIRGAINVFRDLLSAYGQHDMPDISFDRLISSLQSAAKKNDSRIHTDILDVCLAALQGDYANVTVQHDWSGFIALILTCSSRVIEAYTPPPEPDAATPQTGAPKIATVDDSHSNLSASITRVLAAIEDIWERLERGQILEAVRLLRIVHGHINTSQSALLFGVFDSERLCYPDNPDFVSTSWELVRNFILARDKQSEIRVRALEVFRKAYMVDNAASSFDDARILTTLLGGFADERSSTFLGSLVSFFVDASGRCSSETFKQLLQALSVPMNADKHEPDLSPTAPNSHSPSRSVSHLDPSELTLSNISATGLVRIFIRSLEASPSNALKVFEKLVDIARSREWPTDSRLTVIKLLFRLRCDSTGSVYVVPATENEFLLAVLCRTADITSRSSVSEDSSMDRILKNEEGGALTALGRLSLKESTSGTVPLSTSRGSAQLRTLKLTPPLWAYAEVQGLPETPPSSSSSRLMAHLEEAAITDEECDSFVTLKMNLWLEAVITLLQREKDWDVYSYVLVHLSSQLMNKDLFRGALPQIQLLRSVLCDQIKNENFHEPLGVPGVKKADVAICILDSLTMLISFHKHFAKSEQDELVRAFMLGIGSWEGTSRGCIHALSVCCHEIPLSVTKALNAILDKMSKIITRSHVAVHILEFLALLARLPDVYVNLRDEEIRTVFGVCLRFIQAAREQRYKAPEPSASRSSSLPSRLSVGGREGSSPVPAEPSQPTNADNLSGYVYSLTFHVMIFWFLSLKVQDRVNHVNWITKRLIFADGAGNDMVEEQSQVFIDFMQRVAFSDLGDTVPFDDFPPSESDGPVIKKSWVVGLSLITIETAGASGVSQVTKRQASGTTYAMYQQRTAPLVPHQIPANPASHSISDPASRNAVFPSHVLLQMTTTALPTPQVMQPLPLPDDDFTRRAISTFDRNDIVDGHKVGVVYIGHGQTEESQILANTSGSSDYDFFLSGLGTKISIKDAKFNTQGLHSDTDGEFTYGWRDRVTEIIYHVATMMPTNLEADPQCVNKKRHIGNDFVNIIFNHSNATFDFNTIPSQFNFVNIVISPVSRFPPPESESSSSRPYDVPDFNHWYYIVKVTSRVDFPELSAAAIPKVISGRNLASFVRVIALNASFYSLVTSRGTGEYVSSWQNRLRQIKRLRERILASTVETTDTSAETSSPAYRRNTKTNVQGDEGSSQRTNIGAESGSATENLFHSVDFSRWSR